MKETFSLAAAHKAAVFVFWLVASLASTAAWAKVEVVESSNRLLASPEAVVQYAAVGASSVSAQASPSSRPSSNGQAELYFQVQSLQQEVLELRGLLEEQAYELKRLKQQRLDDYLNLDKRLTALSGGKSVSVDGDSGDLSVDEGGSSESMTDSGQSSGQSQDEMQRYRSAIDLALRQKDYVKATVAFDQYLKDFPQGTYAPNSQYWLGEIYLKQGDLEKAKVWFGRLLSDYPDHAKTPDATLKLGIVYDRLGDKGKARSLLNKVVSDNPNTNAARLAKSHLASM